MSKNYIFTKKPYDYSWWIQGVNESGQIINEPYSPATDEQISEFEKKFDCTLSNEYKDFLRISNGGLINPAEIEANGGFAAEIEVKRSLNPDTAFSKSKVVLEFFYTLDEQTLQKRGNREDNLSFILESHYLQNAQEAYRDYVNLQDIEGLVGKHFIVIASSQSPQFTILLSCDELLEGSVLALDTSFYPEKPIDNVAILADSFDEFLQRIYI